LAVWSGGPPPPSSIPRVRRPAFNCTNKQHKAKHQKEKANKAALEQIDLTHAIMQLSLACRPRKQRQIDR
jgi:hypothetical protein